MPSIPRIPGPYRFFFYSFDRNEPVHVHARRERSVCKFWLDPVALADNHGLSPRDLTAVAELSWSTGNAFWRHGVSTAAQPSRPTNDPRVHAVEITDDSIVTHLVDGRTISVPLAWSWRLSDATSEQHAHYELIGDGSGIHWPDIDEDLSVRGMLEGVPARRPSRSS